MTKSTKARDARMCTEPLVIRMSKGNGGRFSNRSRFILYNNNNNNNCFMALCRDYPDDPVPKETFTHSHLIINHPLSASSIYYNPQHPPCSIYMLDGLFAQPLQVLFGLELSTSYSRRFFTRSMSSFHNTCPYHLNLFCYLL